MIEEPEEPGRAGEPGQVGARIVAGGFDLAILFVLAAVLTLTPMWFGGLALPLLGAFAAIFGYMIVPCMLFKKTLGMKLFGLEIVSVDGRNADATELLFRELFGRGLFGAAYFATVVFGIAGWMSGSMALFQPTGMGLVLFFVAGLVGFVGVVGQLVALAARDGRGLPDLMAKTVVIRAGTGKTFELAAADLDQEEKAFAAAKQKRRVRNFVLFEVGLCAFACLLPYGLSRPNTGPQEFADRMELKRAEREFKAQPTNAYRAAVVIDQLRASGDTDRADEIEREHETALKERDAKQEAAIRRSLEANPKSWDTVANLLQLLERQGRTNDARTALEGWVRAEETPDARAMFGVWLYEHGLTDDAIEEMTRAIEGGAAGAPVHAYLGFALQEKGEAGAARAAFARALELDPELYQVRAELEALSN